MRRVFSNHSLNIFELQLTEWPYEVHTHNFCEIILVKKGSGQHAINETVFPYKKGDVFLLTPEDYHHFEIKNPTILLYIKFTEQIFLEKQGWIKPGLIDTYGLILFHSHLVIGSILKDKNETKKIFALSEILLNEYTGSASNKRKLVLELFGAIIIIIIRNLSGQIVNKNFADKEADKVNEILTYIRVNISNEQKLTLATIAHKFNISANYIGEYLQTHTGNGFKKFVIETRIERANMLLKRSSLSVAEIAEKTGFSDVSHMNKAFKRYKNCTPSAIRNSKD